MNILTSIYWESTKPLRLLTIPVCLLAAIGIWLRSSNSTGDMYMLLHTGPWWLWSSSLALVAAARVYGLGWRDQFVGINHGIRSMVVSITAMTVWSMMFVSSAISEDFGLGLLLLIPSIIEVWLLSRAIISFSICEKEIKNE